MITADALTVWLVAALLATMLAATILSATIERRLRSSNRDYASELAATEARLKHGNSQYNVLQLNYADMRAERDYFVTRSEACEARAQSYKAALEAHQHHCRTHHGLSPQNQAKVNESLDRAFSRALAIVDEARHG